jgi:hypothetical protein
MPPEEWYLLDSATQLQLLHVQELTRTRILHFD